MVPPPQTPSPHRFITNPTPKPSTFPRFQQQLQQPSSSQFASAPRFSFKSTQKPVADNATPETQYSSPLSRRPHLPPTVPVHNKEDIVETSPDHIDEGVDEYGATRFAAPAQPTSKRRRPNPPEAITISSDPPSPTSPPSTPLLPTVEQNDPLPASTSYQINSALHHPPRFVLPSPAPSTTTSNIPNRPPLILPPRSPTPPPETPAFFSPHRRGQKYVPGGLASTVRDWIVETAQVGHTRAHTKSGEQEVWDVKFRVGESREGSGVVLVRERNQDRRGILAGRGRSEGVVEVGCVIGIKEPTWEVEIEELKWRVGVEWKVLDG